MTKERICPHCGSDTYFAREFPRVRDQSQWWRREAEKLAAEVAQLKLAAEHSRWRDRTDVAWLQGKVVAQRRALKRLNDEVNAERIRRDIDPRPDVVVSSVTALEVATAPIREIEREG